MNVKPRALIAMSGGVDSSVAALLAQRAGYECTGVTMKLMTDNRLEGRGAANASEENEQIAGAARVAASLGMPHYMIDIANEFKNEVIEPFVSLYEGGKTPNPCILCNTRIKFGLLFDHARAKGFDKLVTGHYARILLAADGSYRLARGLNADKDQSYFLHGMRPETFAGTLFPLGELTKADVRAIACEAGFDNAEKEDSQDICFVQGGDYADFIESYRGRKPEQGDFVDTSGRILGRHGGVLRYTVGQRKGLGIALGKPVYVKEIRPEAGEVVLADENEVFVSHIETEGANWLVSPAPAAPFRASIMVRYRAKPVWATVKPDAGGGFFAVFDEPVRAPARGQSAVLYDGDFVLGGGRIL